MDPWAPLETEDPEISTAWFTTRRSALAPTWS